MRVHIQHDHADAMLGLDDVRGLQHSSSTREYMQLYLPAERYRPVNRITS
jgi:ribonuclease BN (tRNA processing enzyme)